MPEIPQKTRAELDEILREGTLGKLCFESVRSLGIAIITATSLMEDREEYKKNRKSIRHRLVLGHISKCLKLHMSILELDSHSKYGETIEILVNQIQWTAIKGLYFLACEEDLLTEFAKQSLIPFSKQYQAHKANRGESKNIDVFSNFFEDLASQASLDPNVVFQSDFKMPSQNEVISFLGLSGSVIDNYLRASASAVKGDFVFIASNLIRDEDDNVFIKDQHKRISPLVLATSGIALSRLLSRYCQKFLTYEEVSTLLSKYFDEFEKWFEELSKYCTSAYLPDHEIEEVEKTRRTSKISEHKFQKKQLIPPLMAMPNIHLQSWTNDRMPEMLWALLLIEKHGRDKTIPIFRRVINYYIQHEELDGEVTFSGILKLHAKAKFDLITAITAEEASKEALGTLLLLNCIPGIEFWKPFIRQPTDKTIALQKLAATIFLGLDQAGDEASMCRWLRIAGKTAVRKMHFPSEDHYKRIFEYPDYGDRHMVESSIRASEGSLDAMSEGGKAAWIDDFWKECFSITACKTFDRELPTQVETYVRIKPITLWNIYNQLSAKYLEFLPSTHIEPKHDCLWGTALLLTQISNDIISSSPSSSLTLLGLRALVEGIINLKYLLHKNDPELWKKFRDYGIGQAKLNVLKLRDKKNPPHYIPFNAIEKIANEDRWEEYSIVDVGDWSNDNLRKRSEIAKLKELYDDYYIWPSCFAHSQWGAIRYMVFDNCINPLHRLHRVPTSPANIRTVKYDVEILLEKLFELLSKEYSCDDLSFANLIAIANTEKKMSEDDKNE